MADIVAADEVLREVSLKDRMPTVEVALRRLANAIRTARQDRVKVLKLVHGYGSSGVGGKIRVAVRAELADMLARRQVSAVVFGEDYSPRVGVGKDLLRRFPSLADDEDVGRRNPGMTLLVL